MHDPLTVAFEIRRPWPRRDTWYTEQAARTGTRWKLGGGFWTLAGRGFYWPSLVTVWHHEPGGRDGLTVCGRRIQRADGTWHFSRTWRWHVHHWHIQVPPLQMLRRRLLTRCAWCGGRDRKGDPVNVSHSWNGRRGHWWRGEPGLFHSDCSAVHNAHAACVCTQPILDSDGYGHCARCRRFRAYGTTPGRLARLRELAAIPAGRRSPASRLRLVADATDGLGDPNEKFDVEVD